MHTSKDVTSVGILSPDQIPGQFFQASLSKHGTKSTDIPTNISPRILENELTPDTEKVAAELADALAGMITAGHTIITISCNTLSLGVFMKPAIHRLETEHKLSLDGITFVFTINEIKSFVETMKEKRVLVLGTSALSKILASENSLLINPTALTTISNANYISDTSKDAYLHLVQEIIWRVKARSNAVTNTAPVYATPLTDDLSYKEALLKLHAFLTELHVETVVMACTELPIAFADLQDLPEYNGQTYSLVDPAELVGKAISNMQNANKRVHEES